MITGENSGLAAERVELVLALLRERGAARVEELSKAADVSQATIRRDLADLDARGRVRRVHGGAVAVGSRLQEPVFDDKAAIFAAEKQRIAETAMGFIKPNASVFLDGGSTVLALARLLADVSGLTVVTNSLRVAGTLSHGGPTLILLGGELRRLSQTFVGPLTQPVMDLLRVDVAFMGTIGLSARDGLTTTDPKEAFTKRLVMRHAREVVLLADSSKIGAVSFVNFASLKDIGLLITDGGVRAKTAAELRRLGVNVIVARATTRRGRNPARTAQREHERRS
jgi:DeoR/GlpR family transcriptional regulator of sugar metabolism